jgi:PadR family transcriptional regulator, regulatory protein PadR
MQGIAADWNTCQVRTPTAGQADCWSSRGLHPGVDGLTERMFVCSLSSMDREPRMTLPTLRVLKVLLEDPMAERYGLELAQATKLPTGSLYPILIRLEKAGWLASHWEETDPSPEGRPRRRFYRLTGDGAEKAQRILRDLGPPPSPMPWMTPAPRKA